jgi:hypothetical protein
VVDALTAAGGGAVAPGTATAPAVLFSLGPISLDASTTFTAVLNGPDLGTGYSLLLAGGPVDLGGSTLNLVLGFTPALGSVFELIASADPEPIRNTFAGLPEGAVFSQGGLQFQITYQAGGPACWLTRVG